MRSLICAFVVRIEQSYVFSRRCPYDFNISYVTVPLGEVLLYVPIVVIMKILRTDRDIIYCSLHPETDQYRNNYVMPIKVQKTKYCEHISVDIFLCIIFSKCFWRSKESSHGYDSFEYPQRMFG